MLYPLERIKGYSFIAGELTTNDIFILEKVNKGEFALMTKDEHVTYRDEINFLLSKSFLTIVVIADKEVICLTTDGYCILKAKQMVHKYN